MVVQRKKIGAITEVAHLRSNTAAYCGGNLVDYHIYWDGSTAYDSKYYEVNDDKQKIYIKETGIYQIAVFVNSYINGNAGTFLRVIKNGVSIYAPSDSTAYKGQNNCTVILRATLTAGDYISIYSRLCAWDGYTCGINTDSVITFTKTNNYLTV